jgi:hypothetical protein
MFVRVSSVLVLFRVGSGLVTGLITLPRTPTVYEDPYYQINSNGKQARRPNTKGRNLKAKGLMQ